MSEAQFFKKVGKHILIDWTMELEMRWLLWYSVEHVLPAMSTVLAPSLKGYFIDFCIQQVAENPLAKEFSRGEVPKAPR